ncbi:MAG TPA: hypothetical protein VNI54_01300 [Thermoanaerobaculia bacterium]|nr:hypothetical protein [Thermoanaerobaculia bacterium]
MKHVLLALSLSIPAFGQDVVRAIELPRATMRELAATPLREPSRVIEQRWLPPFDSLHIDVIGPVATLEPPVAAIQAPSATTFFVETSTAVSPADASGAVGPTHLVGAHNSAIVVQNRTGGMLTRVTLAQFWFSNAGLAIYYDPRVVYDAQHDRWVVVSIWDEKAVMLAVSETGDPTGAWRRYQFTQQRADYSQLVLSGDSIVAGTTDFAGNLSYYFVVPRTTAYANPATLSATRIDANASNATPVASATQKWIVTGNSLNIAWAPLDNTATWKGANTPNILNHPSGTPLPQAGGPGLDGGLGVVESAVEHDGWIYVVYDRLPRGTSRHIIEWCRFHPVTGAASWGTIVDPDPNVSYGYPSLAINRNGAIIIGFGIFSPTSYASSGYIYRDAAGNWSPVKRIRHGDSAFTVTDRWGDYSSTVVDPVDGTTFWTLQMNAKSANWETTWSRISADTKSKRRTARH